MDHFNFIVAASVLDLKEGLLVSLAISRCDHFGPAIAAGKRERCHLSDSFQDAGTLLLKTPASSGVCVLWANPTTQGWRVGEIFHDKSFFPDRETKVETICSHRSSFSLSRFITLNSLPRTVSSQNL